MKKIGTTIALSAVLLVGMASTAFGAIKIDVTRFYADPTAAAASAPDPDARLRMINQKYAPDDISVVDWLCYGTAPCMVIS